MKYLKTYLNESNQNTGHKHLQLCYKVMDNLREKILKDLSKVPLVKEIEIKESDTTVYCPSLSIGTISPFINIWMRKEYKDLHKKLIDEKGFDLRGVEFQIKFDIHFETENTTDLIDRSKYSSDEIARLKIVRKMREMHDKILASLEICLEKLDNMGLYIENVNIDDAWKKGKEKHSILVTYEMKDFLNNSNLNKMKSLNTK